MTPGRRWLHRALMRGLRAAREPHCPPLDQRPRHPSQLHPLRLQGARGQTLAAWILRPTPDHADSGPARRPAVLALHGWGANASTLWSVVDPLLAAGFVVMLLDASGHGDSGDEDFTSLPRFAEDLAVGLDALAAEPDVDVHRLALIGHSVGAGAALLHAARAADTPSLLPPRAIVSLAAFAHPHEVMRRWLRAHHLPYPLVGTTILEHVQQVIGARFDAIAPVHTIAAVRCPVLLVHGRGDTTVPVSDAQRLQGAHPGASLLLVDADHDLRTALVPHQAEILRFLQDSLA